MPPLDVVATSTLEPWDLLGLEGCFLDRVAAGRSRLVLIVYTMAGRSISIGRYHLYGGPALGHGVSAWRRLTGGRVYGGGQGWLGLALILPNRSALLKESGGFLKPDQLMNRYIRGLLVALRAMGVECFYPGRDAVTSKRREIAMCSFVTERSGAMLFEVLLAMDRSMEEAVGDLERLDPEGTLSCAMYGPETATTLHRELGREPGFKELTDAVAEGYRALLGQIEMRDLVTDELLEAHRRGTEMSRSGWLAGPTLEPEFTHKRRTGSQLGSIEALVALSADGGTERLVLAGDIIANPAALDELEEELRGKSLELPVVSHAVERVFARGDNFFLGAGDLGNLAKLITGAQ